MRYFKSQPYKIYKDVREGMSETKAWLAEGKEKEQTYWKRAFPCSEPRHDGGKKEGDSGRARGLMPVIPALWESEAGKNSRPAWPTWQNPDSPKNTKISQAWWYTPVIFATQEAVAGESFEPKRQRLQ